MPPAKAVWYQDLDFLADEFLAVEAEEFFRLRIDQNDLALLIDNDHRVWSGFQQIPKSAFDQPFEGCSHRDASGRLGGGSLKPNQYSLMCPAALTNWSKSTARRMTWFRIIHARLP